MTILFFYRESTFSEKLRMASDPWIQKFENRTFPFVESSYVLRVMNESYKWNLQVTNGPQVV